MTMMARRIEIKRQQDFDERVHPRDRLGRFIETGAQVRLRGGGSGEVLGPGSNGRILVRRNDTGKHVLVDKGSITVTARPGGKQPTSKPEDSPVPITEGTPSVPEKPTEPAAPAPSPAPAPSLRAEFDQEQQDAHDREIVAARLADMAEGEPGGVGYTPDELVELREEQLRDELIDHPERPDVFVKVPSHSEVRIPARFARSVLRMPPADPPKPRYDADVQRALDRGDIAPRRADRIQAQRAAGVPGPPPEAPSPTPVTDALANPVRPEDLPPQPQRTPATPNNTEERSPEDVGIGDMIETDPGVFEKIVDAYSTDSYITFNVEGDEEGLTFPRGGLVRVQREDQRRFEEGLETPGGYKAGARVEMYTTHWERGRGTKLWKKGTVEGIGTGSGGTFDVHVRFDDGTTDVTRSGKRGGGTNLRLLTEYGPGVYPVKPTAKDVSALWRELDAQGLDELHPIRGVINRRYGNQLYIARDDEGKIAGAIQGTVEGRGARRSVHITQMRVLNDQQGKGTGRDLIQAAARDVGPEGRLSVGGAVETAKGFYARTGAVFDNPYSNHADWTPQAIQAMQNGERPEPGEVVSMWEYRRREAADLLERYPQSYRENYGDRRPEEVPDPSLPGAPPPPLHVDDGTPTVPTSAAEVTTGSAVRLEWAHRKQQTGNFGDRYGQDVEPAGRYLSVREPGDNFEGQPGVTTGVADYDNPLVLEFGGGYQDADNWKRKLSEQYGGKTGRALSQAIRNDGHDVIITRDKYGFSEVVDLTGFEPKKKRPRTAASRREVQERATAREVKKVLKGMETSPVPSASPLNPEETVEDYFRTPDGTWEAWMAWDDSYAEASYVRPVNDPSAAVVFEDGSDFERFVNTLGLVPATPPTPEDIARRPTAMDVPLFDIKRLGVVVVEGKAYVRAVEVEGKAFRMFGGGGKPGVWEEGKHPRDAKGKFIEARSFVKIKGTGRVGFVASMGTKPDPRGIQLVDEERGRPFWIDPGHVEVIKLSDKQRQARIVEMLDYHDFVTGGTDYDGLQPGVAGVSLEEFRSMTPAERRELRHRAAMLASDRMTRMYEIDRDPGPRASSIHVDSIRPFGTKGLRGKFKENQHPRDRRGRFVEVGGTVSIFGGGQGQVLRSVGGGRIEVQRNDGRKVTMDAGQTTMIRSAAQNANAGKKPDPTALHNIAQNTADEGARIAHGAVPSTANPSDGTPGKGTISTHDAQIGDRVQHQGATHQVTDVEKRGDAENPVTTLHTTTDNGRGKITSADAPTVEHVGREAQRDAPERPAEGTAPEDMTDGELSQAISDARDAGDGGRAMQLEAVQDIRRGGPDPSAPAADAPAADAPAADAPKADGGKQQLAVDLGAAVGRVGKGKLAPAASGKGFTLKTKGNTHDAQANLIKDLTTNGGYEMVSDDGNKVTLRGPDGQAYEFRFTHPAKQTAKRKTGVNTPDAPAADAPAAGAPDVGAADAPDGEQESDLDIEVTPTDGASPDGAGAPAEGGGAPRDFSTMNERQVRQYIASGRATPQQLNAANDRLEELADAKAGQLLKRYAKVEPAITEQLQAAADENGARMEGLEFRVKGRESLARKLKDKSAAKGLTLDEYGDEIGDAIRYTMIAPPESYSDTVTSTLNDFRDRGFEVVDDDNTWVPNSIYKGVNAVLKTPDGTLFELQFHTQDSFRVKMGQHVDYEAYRDPAIPVVDQIAAYERMRRNWEDVAVPAGVENVGTLLHRPAPFSPDQLREAQARSSARPVDNGGA